MKKILIVLVSGLFTFQLFGMQCTEKELYGDVTKHKKGMIGLLDDFKDFIEGKIPVELISDEQQCEADAYCSLVLELSKIQTRDESSIYFPGVTLESICSEALMFCIAEKTEEAKLLLEYVSISDSCGFKESLALLHDNCSNYF